MSVQTRLTSCLIGRLARQQLSRPLLARRTLTVSAITRQPDLLQEMYLKEVRAYKPAPQKASDSEGHVQKFTLPKAPKSPEETNLTNDMEAYEKQAVEVEGQATSGETEPVNQDWFEEDEEPQEAAGGH